MKILQYIPDYWNDIQKVHDSARMQELALANLKDAFLPLTVAAEREDLFDYQLYVAMEEESVVGFVAFTEDELAWLYVQPDHQRRGVGRSLAKFALTQMTQEEKSVEVLFGNEPARKLYRSIGFTDETIVHGKMPGNEAFPVTVWQMTMRG
jgi:ribosomal protein S18 acetylase RimI-like enzyme